MVGSDSKFLLCGGSKANGCNRVGEIERNPHRPGVVSG